MRARLLSWLLQRANAHPPTLYRRDFYDLKDRLLRKYGARDGEDVQRLVDQCWGYYEDGGCRGAACHRCGGTGIWSQRWILLERWQLAGRVFHRPVGPCAPRAVDCIDGRIRHEGVKWATAHEAALWLALLCDRALFWRLLRTSRSSGWQWRPILALQAVVFEIRMVLDRCGQRRCHCGRRIWHPFDSRGWMICGRCRRALYGEWPALATANTGEDDDLPF